MIPNYGNEIIKNVRNKFLRNRLVLNSIVFCLSVCVLAMKVHSSILRKDIFIEMNICNSQNNTNVVTLFIICLQYAYNSNEETNTLFSKVGLQTAEILVLMKT